MVGKRANYKTEDSKWRLSYKASAIQTDIRLNGTRMEETVVRTCRTYLIDKWDETESTRLSQCNTRSN